MEALTLNEYQEQAMTTCMDSSNNFSYMMLNLVGEVGEFASKVAKSIRKSDIIISNNILSAFDVAGNYHNNEDRLATSILKEGELKQEAGDILWQLSGLCSVMGWSLEEVAQMNLDKLASRKERNVIEGSGDNR